MGSGPSVEVEANVESPTTPGKRSVMTASLEEYCTFHEFFDAIVPILREPLHPLESLVLKRLEVVELGPEEFTVKIIHDGQKLTAYGFGSYTNDGADLVRLWQTVRCSREKREIVMEEYDEEGKPRTTCITRFLSDPLRLECWCEMADGERKCGDDMAALLKSFYVVPVIKGLMKRKVVVTCSVDSPGGSGKSAISGSLDEYCDYDTCFDAAIQVLQDSVKGGEIIDLSEEVFEMTLRAPAIGDFDADAKMVQLVRHRREVGEIVNVASVGGQLLYTSWIKVHKEPLTVEHWTEVDGKRTCSRQEASVLQLFVDSIISKTDGTSGWFW